MNLSFKGYTVLKPFSLLLFFSICVLGFAQKEKIKQLDIFISVEPDRNIKVTESITVFSNHQELMFGFDRYLPARIDPSLGIRSNEIIIEKIWDNGAPTFYSTQSQNKYFNIFIGKVEAGEFQQHYMHRGYHNYQLTYIVKNQVLPGPDGETLIWPILSSAWNIPIDRSSCTIQLPFGTQSISTVLTGNPDTSSISISKDGKGNILITQKNPFPKRTGFGIKMQLKGGFAAAPPQRNHTIINTILLISILGSVFYWYYHIAARAKNNPKKNPKLLLQLEPTNYSYLLFPRRKNHIIYIITSLVSKGYLSIAEQHENIILKKATRQKQVTLSAEEKLACNLLFKFSDSFVLGSENSALLADYEKDIAKKVKYKYTTKSLVKRKKLLITSLLISLLPAILITQLFHVRFFNMHNFWWLLCYQLLLVALLYFWQQRKKIKGSLYAPYILITLGFTLVANTLHQLGLSFSMFSNLAFGDITVSLILLSILYPVACFGNFLFWKFSNGKEPNSRVDTFVLYLNHLIAIFKTEDKTILEKQFGMLMAYAYVLDKDQYCKNLLRKYIDVESFMTQHHQKYLYPDGVVRRLTALALPPNRA